MRSMLAAVLLLLVASCRDGDSVAPTVEGNDRAPRTTRCRGHRVVRGECCRWVSRLRHLSFNGRWVILVGPSPFGLAERAPSRVPGLAADEYIRQSIVDPEAFVVPDSTLARWSAIGRRCCQKIRSTVLLSSS